MKLTSLPASDFDRLAATTRLRPQQVALARTVLVDGLPVATVATSAGLSKQQVSRSVERIRRAYAESETAPTKARVTLAVTVPPPVADAIDAVAAAVISAKSTQQERVAKIAAEALTQLADRLRAVS